MSSIITMLHICNVLSPMRITSLSMKLMSSPPISSMVLIHSINNCSHSRLKSTIMQVKHGGAFWGPKCMTLNVPFYYQGQKMQVIIFFNTSY